MKLIVLNRHDDIKRYYDGTEHGTFDKSKAIIFKDIDEAIKVGRSLGDSENIAYYNNGLDPKEIFEKGQVLTVAKAKELKGKKIATTNAEYYMNKPHVNIFVVGEIISDWDDAARRKYPDQNGKYTQHENYQQYWASYMSEERIDEQKTRLLLLDENGNRQAVAHTKYYNFYSEPTFTGSDADREVYYVEL